MPLPPPEYLIRFFPIQGTAAEGSSPRRARRVQQILRGQDDRLLVVVGPCSIHDPDGRASSTRSGSRPSGPGMADDLRDRDARLLREAAHHGRLEGADQRSRPRRQLPHQRGPARSRANCCSTSTSSGVPAGTRVPRHDHAAVHRRPGRAGARSARAPPRVAGPSRARLGPVMPGRLQERHRRQRARSRVDAIKAAGQPHHFLSVTKGGHSAIVATARQRGLPRHPARRQASRTTTRAASTPPAATLARPRRPAG